MDVGGLQDIIIDRSCGSVGIMNVTSMGAETSLADRGEGVGLDAAGLSQISSQFVEEDAVKVRLYAGRIARGPLQGARVTMKAYPQGLGRQSAVAKQADQMATNELRTHARLQSPGTRAECPCLAKLLGVLIVRAGASKGEQWLIYRNDGTITAAEYASMAAEATAAGEAIGEGEVWDRFDASRPLRRRKLFVVKVLRQVFQGLDFMHKQGRLHHSLGPFSVALSTVAERDVAVLQATLRDFAFSVDISNEALLGGGTLGELWSKSRSRAQSSESTEEIDLGASQLWRRARSSGAVTAEEQRRFAIADDVYAAGLLVAFLAFVPFSAPGTVDAPRLQRLIETTFRGDFDAIREYAEADPDWLEATTFLGAAEGAGWDLLRQCMHPDHTLRPSAAACLEHPFLKGDSV